jgi:hypothetical protein
MSATPSSSSASTAELACSSLTGLVLTALLIAHALYLLCQVVHGI